VLLLVAFSVQYSIYGMVIQVCKCDGRFMQLGAPDSDKNNVVNVNACSDNVRYILLYLLRF